MGLGGCLKQVINYDYYVIVPIYGCIMFEPRVEQSHILQILSKLLLSLARRISSTVTLKWTEVSPKTLLFHFTPQHFLAVGMRYCLNKSLSHLLNTGAVLQKFLEIQCAGSADGNKKALCRIFSLCATNLAKMRWNQKYSLVNK